jgi:hypothetical protein
MHMHVHEVGDYLLLNRMLIDHGNDGLRAGRGEMATDQASFRTIQR